MICKEQMLFVIYNQVICVFTQHTLLSSTLCQAFLLCLWGRAKVRRVKKHVAEALRPCNSVVKTNAHVHNYISSHTVDDILEEWKTEYHKTTKKKEIKSNWDNM